MNKTLYRIVFFLGWLLSPLTFWNDAFVNIPLAYLLSCVTIGYIPGNFLILTIIYYWLTNILGLIMMAASGAHIFHGRARIRREAAILAATLLLYSLILVLLDRTGILKPIHVFLANR